MRLKFEFSNGVPSVDVFTSTDGFCPIELVVNNGGRASRKKALLLYMPVSYTHLTLPTNREV